MSLTKFALLLVVTFCLIFAFTWLLIFCQRRNKKSHHGGTGICHRQGGPTCGNCAEEKGQETCARPGHHPDRPPPA